MASYLQVENISKSYGDRMLFSGIGFNINEGDKIALIAPNGTGKSTLLKILAGVESSDRGGEVRFMKSIKVAFLDQATPFDPNRCVFDEVYSRLDERTAAVREYDEAVASGRPPAHRCGDGGNGCLGRLEHRAGYTAGIVLAPYRRTRPPHGPTVGR